MNDWMFAEVFDKEPTLAAVWCLAGFFSFVALGFALVRRWGVFVALFGAAVSVIGTLNWLRDPTEGPAIVRELGREYVVCAYVAGFCPMVSALIGVWVRWRWRRIKT